MVQGDECHVLPIEFTLAELADGLGIAEDFTIVAADRFDMGRLLTLAAFLDHTQGRIFNVEQIKPTAASGLQNTELGPVAGADRKGGYWLIQRQRFVQRTKNTSQHSGDVYFVVAVARPDLVLRIHVSRAGPEAKSRPLVE